MYMYVKYLVSVRSPYSSQGLNAIYVILWQIKKMQWFFYIINILGQKRNPRSILFSIKFAFLVNYIRYNDPVRLLAQMAIGFCGMKQC